VPDERVDTVRREAVPVEGRLVAARSTALETGESGVDAPPSRADEVDEKREVVDARVTLREEVSFDPLQAPNRLIEEATNLRDVSRDRQHLGAKPVADGLTDLNRDRRLEPGGNLCEGFDLLAGAFERGLDQRGLGATRSGICDALLGTFQSEYIHGRRGYSPRRMDTALLDYDLPEELIAQQPTARRDDSRLLVYRRGSAAIEHRVFSELPDLVGDELTVLNDTRVLRARLPLRRATGGLVEVLLVEERDDGLWEGLARPSRRLRAGERLGPIELVQALGDGRWLLRLGGEPDGEVPLPPYIHERLADPERYQTVYAHEPGSAAAPTAGLHFTPELLARLDHVAVTLHVGIDTFRPIATERIEDHRLLGERYRVTAEAWERVASSERVLAVGTTTVRVLETVARTGELSGRTDLFVTPGFEFRRVDALLTNFHLPRSSLLALVMAFVGVEQTRELDGVAIAEGYRFYSFGDAMLVL
jgi:S-adenosylmethionine:tRNA ribosyltransferase-isomerase